MKPIPLFIYALMGACAAVFAILLYSIMGAI